MSLDDLFDVDKLSAAMKHIFVSTKSETSL